MTDSLECAEWAPPAPPLTVGEVQRGVAPVSYVRNERANDPFDGEFEHWSALPALSYFALNAVTLRESLRRITPPTTFRPPPRLTLSDQRRQSWLNDLKNPSMPLRMLSRAVPHGFTSTNLLNMLVEMEIPIFRAVWFIKCIGANEVRALKRKITTSNNSDGAGLKKIENTWLLEWTQTVIKLVSQVINSFDDIDVSEDPKNDNSHDNAVPMHNEDEIMTESNDFVQNNGDDDDIDDDNDSINELFGSGASDESKESIKDDCHKQSVEEWQKRMEYASHLSLSLYNASLLDRHAFLAWLISELRDCDIQKLPCFIHFVQLLWKPMTSSTMAPKLLRTIAYRYRSIPTMSPAVANTITTYLEPLVFKLMSTNENTFVTPRTWPTLEPHVRTHPAYSNIAERNQAFMPRDPHDPSDWSQLLVIGELLDNFVRPYPLNDLMSSLNALDVDAEVLVRTILLRTLRQGTTGSISLCIVLLKRLAGTSRSAMISEYCVEFLLDTHLVYGSGCLGALVSELIRARLCHLDRYLSKLISRDFLYNGVNKTNLRELHLRILQDLPFDWLPPNISTQISTMLWRAGVIPQAVDLEQLVSESVQTLYGKQPPNFFARVNELHVNDNHRLANRLNSMFDELTQSEDSMPTDPATFSQFAELMDLVGTGSIRPLYKVLISTVTSPYAQPAIVGSVLRQVHIRLMAFVCSGLIDPFVRRLLAKLKDCVSAEALNITRYQKVFQWVSWDDISALRAVIQSPDVMCELNSVVPLRQIAPSTTINAGNTPVERDAFIRNALYKPGCPDIGALLTTRGDESLAQDIVEWSQSPNVDRVALLQLLTYHAVGINELVDASSDKFNLMRFLLLTPSNELGFCLEEVEALQMIRYKYLSQLPLDKLLEFSTLFPPIQCASRIAHVYPNLYINHVVIPAMKNETTLEMLKKATIAEMHRFEVLFLRCNPFNLRFYQGLVLLTFHGMSADQVADEVLSVAHAYPEASPALQGLLQYLDDETKNLIFTKTVEQFLANGLDAEHLPRINVHYTLVGALASSVTPHVQWSLQSVPEFLEHLVHLANSPDADRKLMRKILILVLRISVVARLHDVELPAAAVPYLETLLHIQSFADNHKMRTIIEDALRLLLRIARKYNDDRHAVLVNDDDECLTAGLSAVDGLRIFSKSCDEYGPLPVWSFDLIEDANPGIGRNDGAIDLSLFEAYED